MQPAPVTLSSDFGRFYPAAMRGVLLARGIATVQDVTHALPRQNVPQSAFWLRELLPYFPPAVHCIVIDPGVGGDRDVLVMRAGGHALVGPDNGVMRPVARRLTGSGEIEHWRFEHVQPGSATFHGRDVFAPVAAAVATLGIERLEALPTLEPKTDVVDLTLPTPTAIDGGFDAPILAIDGFGNVITGLPGPALEGALGETVWVNGDAVPMRRRYGAVEPGKPVVTIGSHGYVELAVNQQRGDDAFGVAVGDWIRLERTP